MLRRGQLRPERVHGRLAARPEADPLVHGATRPQLGVDDGHLRIGGAGSWPNAHHVELLLTPTSASYLNRIECHFRPLRQFVLNASDYASHAEVAKAFRRYLHRRNTDHRPVASACSNPGQELPDTALVVLAGTTAECVFDWSLHVDRTWCA